MHLICVIKFNDAKTLLLMSKEVLLVIRTNRCCWLGLEGLNWLKRVHTRLT
jgi:hypothetical protein